MKKVIGYIVLMLIIVVVIPLIIVHNFDIGTVPENTADKKDSITINVYVSEQKKVVNMQLEDYLLGVVAAEMPASFETEALKAQAIAARTYALGRATKLYGSGKDDVHNGADVCTDPGHCQAWISKDTAMKRWGFLSSFRYWNKICKAVKETSGQVLEYDNVLINPLFHSNSGGHTENAEDVWAGTPEPYLKGVESFGEENSKEYKNEVIWEQKDIIKALKEFNPKIKIDEKDIMSDIEIKKYSSGDRVMDMKIGNITMKGTDFRKILQLKSANFKLTKLPDSRISITTLGYGHGVGMSQCGANYMAQKGSSCEEILKYYYRGVEIKNPIKID
ncbi:stage II sporulation protein D [Ruminiclostridium sufflavum DSM 19573]|uniref:Stage II sporulation protein D n=1 Tax=Ruminiclostridium sufflavum DSM 19573 TaxID=1121337 RepID=A0A318XQG3_9FIRM|nr:stage II sporulation protein D [Ruminiclostridium sufflavum]PYG89518.1 stage II sporulation protein D [Ruminiclostridium sufflavum DSM 19573]